VHLELGFSGQWADEMKCQKCKHYTRAHRLPVISSEYADMKVIVRETQQ
jgi:ribosomal protein L32